MVRTFFLGRRPPTSRPGKARNIIMSKRKLPQEESARNTALRVAVKSFPARSWRELDRVGEALLGRCQDNDDAHGSGPARRLSVAEALRIVDIWRMRQSNLPHAIESTASIAAILYQWEEEQRHVQEQERRLLLSAVIIRTVNGLADVLQERRAVATSVVGLCAALGLPAWIVQLRHEATHQQLPPLPTLRLAATALLAFLDATFWTPLRQAHEQSYRAVGLQLTDYAKKVNEYPLPPMPPVHKGDSNNTTSVKDGIGKEGDDDNGGGTSVTPEDEEDDDPFGLTGSRLGSNKNQFALLQYKKKKKVDDTTTAPTKKRKEQKKKEMATVLTQLAFDLVVDGCRDVPPDILFSAMMDFLVGDEEQRFGVASGGVLATMARPHYRFLLKVLSQAWPGFLPTLLVHCVARASSSSSSSTTIDMTVAEQQYMAAVKFLCSKALVRLLVILPDEKRAVKGAGEDYAPAATLLSSSSLRYPLNSLADRAEPGTPLHGLLLEILGAERIPGYGIVVDNDHDDDEFATTTTTAAADGSSAPSNTVVAAAESTATAAASPWKRCVHWEPCPLGSLPTDSYYY
jgi:hypothetical protein